jgi:FKBP-type peptidyl-prolyl cis-trans isomerase
MPITEGSGKSPTASDNVEVHYEGTLIDGTVFDSSYARGETITFPLSGVIRGWTEGLQLMKEGGKAKLTIPSDIAYGDRGSPPKIPPKATLIFTVELIAIK